LVKGFVSKGDLEKRRKGVVKTLELINLEERIEEKVGVDFQQR
jgi:hypothetical protein